MIRESLRMAGTATMSDPVAKEALRADLLSRVDEIQRAKDRTFDFAARGLISEAASVVIDFPDLVAEAEGLIELAMEARSTAVAWRAVIGPSIHDLHVPSHEEIDRLGGIVLRADKLRPLLDALRLSALRHEPSKQRVLILRKLRDQDPRNRMWLDQIEAIETDWIRAISELRNHPASREELEAALVDLETHEWVAGVPRGLREELFAKVKPLRVEEAETRYRRLADRIADAYSRMNRSELLELEKAWALVHHETGRRPADELARMKAPASAWLDRVRLEEKEQRAFDEMVARLEKMLADGASVAEIEGMRAMLQDSGRMMPESLARSTEQRINSHRALILRKRLLVIAAALVGVIVLFAIALTATSLFKAQLARAEMLERLRDAIAAGDAPRLSILATQARASSGDPDSELEAALRAADGIISARVRREEEVRAILTGLEREIPDITSRARLQALGNDLAALRPEVAEGDRPLATRVESTRIAALEALDTASTQIATDALMESDRVLLPWPSPDKWSVAEQVDDRRWAEYLAALADARARIDVATARVGSHAPSSSRLAVRRTAIAGLEEEARLQSASLRTAMSELSDDRLLVPVASETEFVRRIEAVVAAHGAVIERRGEAGAFSATLKCSDAYRAMEAWRTRFRPKLVAALGSMLAGPPAAGNVVDSAGIRAFVAANPDLPMRAGLEQLAGDLDPSVTPPADSPQAVAGKLASRHISGIEEVRLVDGRRFYRRPATSPNAPPIQKHPLTRAIKNEGELAIDPDRLSSILTVSEREIDGKPLANRISVAWSEAEMALTTAQSHQVTAIMLQLVQEILAAGECDVLLRFRALSAAAAVYEQSGHAKGRLREALESWRIRSRSGAANALAADWVALGYDSEEVNGRRPRSESASSIANFPDVDSARQEAEARLLQRLDSLAEFVPAGVVGQKRETSRFRPARISPGEGVLFVMSRGSAGWTMVPVRVEHGELVDSPAGLPDGPMLIYRMGVR
jgi:hypothetical protein